MPQIEIKGLKGLRKELKNAGEDLKDLKAIHKEAAELVATAAHGIVPKLTGKLDASIKASGLASGGKVKAGRGTKYGAVIHFGWARHNISPHPFLYEALDSRADQVVSLYNERLAEFIDSKFVDGVHD